MDSGADKVTKAELREELVIFEEKLEKKLETKLDTKFKSFEADFNAFRSDFNAHEANMKAGHANQKVWFYGAVTVLYIGSVGAIFALLKYVFHLPLQ